MSAAIEVTSLSKYYGSRKAVSNISFRVEKGEVVGLLGVNGAGKSTTMNILCGCLGPTSGKIAIDSHDPFLNHRDARRRVGYLPEQPPVYPEMTVSEYLLFVARLRLVSRRDSKKAVDRVLEQARITDVGGRKIGNLSKGYRQRVGLAGALVGDPEILVLDEPTAGLDPRQIVDIRLLIEELGHDHTVILSSHILPEVRAVCARVIMMHEGRIVADGTLEDIARSMGEGSACEVEFAPPTDIETAKAVLESAAGVSRVTPVEAGPSKASAGPRQGAARFTVYGHNDSDPRQAVFAAASAAGLPLVYLAPRSPGLEEVFVRLTSGEEV
ncbi:MAG: ABC transporter ATP-binding protein [Spirochaetales bacterium]